MSDRHDSREFRVRTEPTAPDHSPAPIRRLPARAIARSPRAMELRTARK